MTEFLKTITDFMTNFQDRYGAKTLVAIVAIAVVGWLMSIDKISDIPGAAAIAVIAVGFFIWRHLEDKGISTNKEVTP